MRTVARKLAWVLLAVWCVVAARVTLGGQQSVPGLKLDEKSIGGTVVNSNGGKPEAGVWVIAETKSLRAPFRKISSPTIRAGIWFRTCRKVTTSCGCAATG